MKLNQTQIQGLYVFTKQHYVEHYDLQTELVDHLANDIEAMWQEQPQLSFEDAKTKAFKKFGVFGFMEPIEQKQKAMNKYYLKYLFNELKLWFNLPKLITTIVLFIILCMAFSSPFCKHLLIVFYLGICLWSFYKSITLKKQFRLRKKKSNKKWMLEEIIFKQAGGTILILMSQFPTWFNISNNYFSSFYFTLGASIFSTLFFIWIYISFEILPNKAENLLVKTYPEYSM